jgi:hypothetical protein
MQLKKHFLLGMFCFGMVFRVSAQTLDQSHLIYDTPLLGRNLSGYSVFQYFTAGMTGTMVGIDLGVVGPMNGAATLKVYSGMDTTGALLQTTPLTISCQTGSCSVNFPVWVPVVSSQTYTFRFIPGPGISDPYYLQAENPGSYAGGRFGFINPFSMGYTASNPDVVFETYVLTPANGIAESSPSTGSWNAFPNPASERVSIGWENGAPAGEGMEWSITDLTGHLVRRFILAPREASVDISGLQRGIYFITSKGRQGQRPVTQKLVVN